MFSHATCSIIEVYNGYSSLFFKVQNLISVSVAIMVSIVRDIHVNSVFLIFLFQNHLLLGWHLLTLRSKQMVILMS